MGLVTRSSRRQLSTLIHRAVHRTAKQIAGRQFEPLEERVLYTAAPTLNIAGPSIIPEGSPYTLSLSATGTNVSLIDHWTVNWGDSQVTTFAGNPSSVTHNFADGPSSAVITATATLSDGTVVNSNLGGAASDNGTLDPSFNSTGKVTVNPGGTITVAKGVVVQSDGKVVEVGSTDGVAEIVRFNADGSLDTTFNGTGKLVSAFSNGFVATAVSMQTIPNPLGGTLEKILVAGNTTFHSALVRLNLDGTLDTTFGTGGIETFSFTNPGDNNDGVRGLAVMSDGRIVTAGVALNRFNSATQDIALARFTANGAPDVTFNGTGQVTTDLGGQADTALKVLLNANNSIVVLAQGFVSGTFHSQILRYNVNGTLDNTFGVGGIDTLALPNQFFGEAIALDASGNMLVSGTVNTFNGTTDAAVARFNATNGALDTTFGSSGIATLTVDTQNDDASSVLVQSDGKILLGGSTTSTLINSGTADNFFIARLTTSGAEDSTFGAPTPDRLGNVGIVHVDFSGGDDDSDAMTFTNDDRAILAGDSFNIAGTTATAALAQFGSVGTSSSPVTVTITNVPPTVSIVNLPATSNEGTTLALSANVADPSPVDTAAGFSYLWEVSKGSSLYATATTSTFNLLPNDNGLYQVTLIVTDKDGGAASDTHDLIVNNVAPTVTTIGAPLTSPESTTITASATATDPSSVDTAAGFTFGWSVTKNGSAFASGSGASASFTPDDNGTYVLTLSAADKDGGVGSSSSTITVTNVAPVASVVAAPTAGTEGSEITFTGSATDVSPVDAAAGFAYSWTVTKDGNSFASGNGATIDFTPNDNGAYVVTLTATDKDGGAGSASANIAVANVAPSVLLPGAPASGDEGSAVVYSGAVITDPSSVDTAAGFATAWTVTKNGVAFASGSGTSVNFTPDDNGDYVLTLSATDKDGATSSASADITIANVAPTVTVTAPASGDEGSAVTATAGAADPSTVDTAAGFTFAWSVTKDGSAFASGAGASATFTPDDNAAYVVTFSATDKDGGSSTSSASITVNNVAPTVTLAGAPTSGSEGTAISYSGAAATDPSAVDTATGFTYTWTVAKDGNAFANGSGTNINFTPDDNGSYVLTVSATDKDGGVGSASSAIAVDNVAPTVTLTAPTTGAEGSVLSATSSATDPSSVDTAAGFTYGWSVTKDGNAFASGSGASASFTPDDNGTYLLTLTATDKDGGVGSAASTITVTNVAPTFGAVTAPANVSEGDNVIASASATDPSSVDTAAGLVYTWSVSKNGNDFADGAGSSATFTPDDNGTYLVTFTATDKDGGVGTTSATIVATNVAPTVTLAGAPTAGSEGSTIFYSGASATDPSSVDTAAGLTYAWSVTKNGNAFAAGSGQAFAFTPDDNGTYIFTVTATDKDGGVGSASSTVNVANVAPTVMLNVPSAGNEGAPITGVAFAFDPSSVDRAAGLTYAWSVTKNGNAFAAGAGQFATFTPDDNGVYILSVTATDKDGGVGAASSTITIANVAPSFGGSGASSISPEGTTITSTAVATDPSSADTSAGLTYAWSVTKNGASFAAGAGSTAVFTPNDNGTYILTQTATDKDGATGTTSSTINVTNVAPTVSLPGTPSSGSEGSAISYAGAVATDPSTVDTAAGFTFSWSVTKNGSAFASGAGASASFTPDDNGAYVLTITATDKDGGSSSASDAITVANVAPTVTLHNAPAAGNEGSAISFTATATDPSSVDTAAGLNLAWSVTKNGVAYTSGTGGTIAFTPNDNGAYAVTVTATDKDGGSSSATANIAVANVAPAVSLSNVPTSGNEGTPIAFAASTSITDPSSVDTAAGFTTTWSVTKNGSPFASGSGSTVSFTPNDNGTYVLTLTAADKDGGAGSASSTINVLNVAPTVSLTNVPTTGSEGTAISFTAGSSVSDPSSVDTAAGFTIAWSVAKNGSAFAAGSGTAIAFTPDDNGTYVLTLSATDKDGGVGSASRTINIVNVAPTITSVTDTPSTAVRQQTINFGSAFTDPGIHDNPTASWNFGDGATAAGAAASHVYTATGTYTVTLTVTDKDGGVTTTTRQVTILAATIETDPADPTKTALFVGGTSGNDNLAFTPSGSGIKVVLNNVNLGVFNITGRIVALMDGGNDTVQVSASLNNPTELYGGDGNDQLKGGSGPNIIDGGAGNDTLVGGSGRDILIGGGGADQASGQGGDDILVAGSTSYDTNPAALEAIMKEWNRQDLCFADRVLDILLGGGLNGSYELNSNTVFNDAAGDTLTGGTGNDLFIFNNGDTIVGYNLLQDVPVDLSWITIT